MAPAAEPMESFYAVLFAVLATVCVGLEWPRARTRAAGSSPPPPAFQAFRQNYLIVYSLAMAGDWLQGPYVYALYAAYGFSQGDIGKLFIAGFGSSMVFGTVVGSLGDRYGRRSASLLYCATYAASCATKHWNNYGVLMVGRVLGGVATSLLFTAFESWLVSEHGCRGYDPAWLSGTFSRAVFLGNGLVAILSGLVANTLVTTAKLGPTAPFDAAAVALSCGGALIWFTWTENYGGGKSGGSAADKEAGGPPSPVTTDAFTSLKAQFRTAAAAISGDPRVGLLGAMQSLFEASMYSFVFLWTPALSPNGESIPHGFIFATFMLSSMIGSSLAARLLRPEAPVRPEVYMQAVFAASAACLAAPVLVAATGMGPSAGWAVKYGAFNAFEVCVGIFWPSMMKLRATYVPEDVRSTIMNMFRIPLNLFVCVILYNVSVIPQWLMFSMCSAFLLASSALQRRLEHITNVKGGSVVDAGHGHA